MPTPIKIKELARATSNARLKRRYLAVYYFESGYSRTQIAKILGVARGSVNVWIKRYVDDGLEALIAKKSPGRPTRLTDEQLSTLAELIKSHTIKNQGEHLNAEDVRKYIYELFNVDYSQRNVYRILHTLGLRCSKWHKQSIESQEALRKP